MARGRETDESGLVARIVVGDRRAFTRLAEPLLSRQLTTALHMLGSRAEAEDAVQDALASAWLARARIDPARPVLPFLTTITLNKCRDRLRRRKSAAFLGLGSTRPSEYAEDGAPSPESEAADRQALDRTLRAVAGLSLRLQEALVLVAVEGRSQREVAGLLGISEKTVETRVYRARKALKKALDR